MATMATVPAQKGSCLCGAITYSYDAAPVFTAVCYCDDCAKFGTSTVLQVPESGFRITSTTKPKTFTKVSDFQNVRGSSKYRNLPERLTYLQEITSHLCPECGVTLYRTGGAKEVQGLIGIRGGTLDDQAGLRATPPAIEVFVERRPEWRNKIGGAVQMDSKYAVIEDDSGSSSVVDQFKSRGASEV